MVWKRLGFSVLAVVTAATGLTASAVSANAAPAPVTTLYASPGGSGPWCASFAPCSITQAQQDVRWLAPVVPGDLVVSLAGGTYQLKAPLNFTAADSGQNGHRIRWVAATGRPPTISGGVPVKGWTATGTAGLWSAKVPADLDTRQLYADGARVPRSSGDVPSGWTQTATGFATPDTKMASWRNPSSIEMVLGNGHGSWSEPRCDVASITGTAITMKEPCWNNMKLADLPTAANGDNPAGGFPSYPTDAVPTKIENAFELLGAGTWYLDQTQHVVYYQAKTGEDPRKMDFVAPKLEKLVTSSTTAANPLHDVSFEGLQFAYATWLQPSGNDGFVEIQANFTLTGPNAGQSQGLCQYSSPAGTCPFASWTRPGAAVDLTGTKNVSFLRNTFTHLGGAGLGLQHGILSDLVQGNTVTDVSGIGILLGAVDDPQPLGGDQREIATGNTIDDNYVHNVGVEYTGAPAIVNGYSRGTSITHNEIGDVPYSGISSGWGGWHTDSERPHENPNINGDNTISNNLIYRDMLTRFDGGAVYTNGPQGTSYEHGLTVSGNVNFSGLKTANTVYDDEGGDYVTITGNVQYNDTGGFNGGCSTTGHLRRGGNYHVGTLNSFGCSPPPVGMEDLGGNKLISQNPQAGEIPNTILAAAGLRPAFAALSTSLPPVVALASPTCTGNVLISGSGFTADSKVSVGGTQVKSVTFISTSHLSVQLPAGSAGGAVSVTTNSGTSAVDVAANSTLCQGLSTGFGNVGITSDSNTGAGNIDGSGYSFSADALAAQGINPGTLFTSHGTTFTWPTASPGNPDNALAAAQTVGLIGSSPTLGFLVTSTYPASGTGTVNYSDGTTQSYTLSVPNWEGTPPDGADPVITLPYRNGPNGRDDRQVHVYYAGVSLDASKTVKSVQLPNVGGEVGVNVPALHVFAVALAGNPDLALGKPVTASSADFGGVPTRAVDGDTNGNFTNNSVSHSDQTPQPWLQVDLGAVSTLSSVNVWNRTDCCPERLNDFWVFTSATPFDTTLTPQQQAAQPGVWSSHRTGPAPQVTTVTPGVPARYVMVQLNGTNYLSLAEVEAFGK
jgi:hypothetical protein